MRRRHVSELCVNVPLCQHSSLCGRFDHTVTIIGPIIGSIERASAYRELVVVRVVLLNLLYDLKHLACQRVAYLQNKGWKRRGRIGKNGGKGSATGRGQGQSW